MVSQLFLLQFFVEKITFEPTFTPIPAKGQIGINFRFSNIFDMDIEVVEFPLAAPTERGETINYNLGMSHLFVYNLKDLMKELRLNPLEIKLIIDAQTEGFADVKWKQEFMEHIKRLENAGTSKSYEYECDVEVKNPSEEIICNLLLAVHVSLLGDNIESQFQAQRVNERYYYTFKNPQTSDTFKCKRVLSGDVAEIYSIFNPVVSLATGSRQDFYISGKRSSKQSQPVEELLRQRSGGIPLTEIFQHHSGDTVSMCFHIGETKFFDWLNYMSAEAGGYHDQNKDDGEFEDPLNMTADQINSRLCGHKDCPGVKLFKELGIGPLATEKGMLDDDVEVPVQAGLSHIHRKMSTHGPYGKFCRPKRLDEPFVPPKNALETRKPPCPRRKEEKCKTNTKRPCPCCACPPR